MFDFLADVVDFVKEVIVETSRRMTEDPWKY